MLAPLVTPQLLDKVRAAFPAQPNRKMEPREIDWQIGHQEVIEFLQLLHDRDGDDASPFDLNRFPQPRF